MLSGSFYDIQSFTDNDPGNYPRQITAVARLNGSHPIFGGHFPGNPVVPGVCQVQMVRELVEKAIGHPLRLAVSDNIKFLSMINPQQVPQLEFRLTIRQMPEQRFSVSASIVSDTAVFLKFKGDFLIEA